MSSRKNKKSAAVLIKKLVLLWLACHSVLTMASTQVDMTMKGRLLEFPPCDISLLGAEGSEGAPIRIGFDEVAIQRIDGERYRQNFTLAIRCEQTLGQNVLIEMGYNGEPSHFDSAALGTGQADLGVRLYQANNGQVIPPHSVLPMTLSGNERVQLPLYAVPVKAADANLIEGSFTASATLALNYP
ncbi:fimbrial protein [Providencia manganoxydans]